MTRPDPNKILLLEHLQELGLKNIVSEMMFHPVRKWRFDLAIPSMKLAIEIEGGIYQGRGRHIRPKGFEDDCEKYNQAVILGWDLIRVSTGMVQDGRAKETIRQWKEKNYPYGEIRISIHPKEGRFGNDL